jgi:dTDP-4-dehydrorhamnose 3,5-epimerase
VTFEKTPIPGAVLVRLDVKRDERGSFARTFCREAFEKAGLPGVFVQGNHSYNARKGTFRGLHYQAGPDADAKLVRCAAGGIVDFLLDLRPGPGFLKSWSVELQGPESPLLFVPPGVAHGFYSTADETHVLYQHTRMHDPARERGVRHDDPRVKLRLPGPIAIISERDRGFPDFTEPAA